MTTITNQDVKRIFNIYRSLVDKDLNSGAPTKPNESYYYEEVVKEFNKISEEKEAFFKELAEKLRQLWPSGEKDGKYPWRDSVVNITERLKLVWSIRNLKDYTIDECLTAARRYLNQYENNAKYMKTLKYFILRQNERVVHKDGRIHYINQSTFADMLENQSTLELQSELEEAFVQTNSYEVGELI